MSSFGSLIFTDLIEKDKGLGYQLSLCRVSKIQKISGILISDKKMSESMISSKASSKCLFGDSTKPDTADWSKQLCLVWY